MNFMNLCVSVVSECVPLSEIYMHFFSLICDLMQCPSLIGCHVRVHSCTNTLLLLLSLRGHGEVQTTV
jgi:hypothetical protein